VASLVLGILGGVLLAIIFGVVALRQIKRRGDRGRGMAIAGIVLGGLWTLLIVLVVILAATGYDEPSQTGAGNRDVTSLQVGECTADLPEGRISDLQVIPCDQPHRNEVYANLDLPAGRYPGDDAMDTKAEQMCSDKLEAILGGTDLPGTAEIFYLAPRRSTWAVGDRTITCMLHFPADRTGRMLPA
jgi:hypothetical protein